MPTRILIADDDATIRLLLRRLLEKLADWQVCGEASNGVEAIEGVEQFEPDIVVMDLAMPVMNGLQAGPEIARAHPRLPMLNCFLLWNATHKQRVPPRNLTLKLPKGALSQLNLLVGLAHLEGYCVENNGLSAYYWLRVAEENSCELGHRRRASSSDSEAR
jgi:CheY-like chemotaxis protein